MPEINVGKNRNIWETNSFTFEERKEQLKQIEENEEIVKQKEKNSPFGRWTQYNNEHTKEMMWLALKYPKAHAILLFLVDQMDYYNAVMCSYQVLEEVLNVSKDTVRRNIKILKEKGFIAILKNGTSNVYTINDSVYWKSWGNNKKYSKFPANVILALSEQDENYQISFNDIKTEKHKEISKKVQEVGNP